MAALTTKILQIALKIAPAMLVGTIALFAAIQYFSADKSQLIDNSPEKNSEVRRAISSPSATDNLPQSSEESFEEQTFDESAVAESSSALPETTEEQFRVIGYSDDDLDSPKTEPSKKARPVRVSTTKVSKKRSKTKVSKSSSKVRTVAPVVMVPPVIIGVPSETLPQVEAPEAKTNIIAETPPKKEVSVVNSVLDSYTLENNISLEDGEMIVDVYLKRNLIYRGMFCPYKKNSFYVPMGELFETILFPIEVNNEGASGWFLQEDRKFSFSASSGVANVGVRTFQVPKQSYFVDGDEIYLNLEWFNNLFPLNMTFEMSSMILRLTPAALLSFELLQQRIDGRRLARGRDGLRYPLQDLDYAAITAPILDLRATVGHTNQNSNPSYNANLSGIYRGDFLYLSSVLYGAVAVNKGEKSSDIDFNNFSFTGERVFDENPYLTKFTLGDIIPATTPIGSSGALERGVRVSNSQILGTTENDTKTFAGKALPGWEVELYRNDQLVGFRTVGADGNYIFEDIELFYGDNRFRIALYGPEGQEENREEIVTMASSLKAGEVRYDISASQQKKGIFSDEISKVNTSADADSGNFRGKSSINIGIGGGIGIRTGLTADTYLGKERIIGSAGFNWGFADALFGTDIGYSTNEATIIKATLNGKLGKKARYSLTGHGQITEKYIDSNTKYRVRAAISDSTEYSKDIYLTYGGSIARSEDALDQGEDSKVYDDFSANFNINSLWGTLSNSLTYRFYEKSKVEAKDHWTGVVNYYLNLDKGSLRGNIVFGTVEDNEVGLGSAEISGNYQISDETSTTASISKSFIGTELITFRNSWSHKIADYTPYLTGSVDSKGGYSMQAGVGLSLGFDPDTYEPRISGNTNIISGASCLVYQDNNYNNKFDGDDQPLRDVQLKALQAGQQATTNDNGRALFYRLPPLSGTDIVVDETTLSDAGLYAQNGTAIAARKGFLYDLEFPVQLCGLIDGYVYRLARDTAQAFGQVPIQVVGRDGSVVGKGYSLPDGYYIIEKIIPGEYTVRVDPKYLDKKSYIDSPVLHVTVSREGEASTSPLIFVGDSNSVNTLAGKFRRVLAADNDSILFANFTNLDEESDISFEKPAILTLDDIKEDTGILAPAPVLASVPKVKKEDNKIYSLIVDVFTLEKSAKRAVNHYGKIYAEELNNCIVSYQKEGDKFNVVVGGIKGRDKLTKIANLFICEEQAISAAPTPVETSAFGTTSKEDSLFVVDRFKLEKSAKRAVKHYNKMYEQELGNYNVSYQKDGDKFNVVVKGIKGRAELTKIETLFKV